MDIFVNNSAADTTDTDDMRFRWRRVLLPVALLSLFLLVLEEQSGGSIFILYQNRYSSIFLRNITVKRTDPKDIALIIVNTGKSYHNQYSLARDTIQCYSKLHGYSLYFLDITQNPSLASKCPHKDFMFKRHCVLANFMSTIRHEWIFFLDGDIGVVNPNRLLEEFIPEKRYSLVFYERIMNQEIMAGSYLARNDDFARRFLMDWANYEFKTPKDSFHGTDNGAIHSVLADLVVPSDLTHRTLCSQYWNNSKDYYSLSVHEVCLQLYLSKFPPPKVKILEKGRLSWVRDGWLTNSVWSSKDFMFHGWQERRKDRIIFARWHSPILERNFELDLCANFSTAADQWRYKDTFFQSDIVVDQKISQSIADSYGDFVQIAKGIWKRLGI